MSGHKHTSPGKRVDVLAEPGTGKDCSGCYQHKTKESFSKNKLTRDGLSFRCKTCEYLSNTGAFHKYEYASEPLKRAGYETRIINGREYQVYVKK
jgi:hypothetical protein